MVGGIGAGRERCRAATIMKKYMTSFTRKSQTSKRKRTGGEKQEKQEE